MRLIKMTQTGYLNNMIKMLLLFVFIIVSSNSIDANDEVKIVLTQNKVKQGDTIKVKLMTFEPIKKGMIWIINLSI